MAFTLAQFGQREKMMASKNVTSPFGAREFECFLKYAENKQVIRRVAHFLTHSRKIRLLMLLSSRFVIDAMRPHFVENLYAHKKRWCHMETKILYTVR